MPELILDDELAKILEKVLRLEELSKEEAKRDAKLYLSNKDIDIKTLAPGAVVLIIASLSKEEQVEFVKKNIGYIKDNIEIFEQSIGKDSPINYLYYESIKAIHDLDKNTFKDILTKVRSSVFSNYKDDGIIKFYQELYEGINELEDITFVVYLVMLTHTQFFSSFDKIKEFYNMVTNKYSTKILNLQGRALLEWCEYFGTKEYFQMKKNDVNKALLGVSQEIRDEFFMGLSYNRSDSNSLENIIYILDDALSYEFLKLSYKYIHLGALISLSESGFDIDLEYFVKNFELRKLSAKSLDSLKRILDTYDYNIVDLIDKHLLKKETKNNIVLSYLEKKYRDSIVVENELCQIDASSDTITFEYLKNLSKLKEMIKNHEIDTDSEIYKEHLKIFVKFLNKKGFINQVDSKSLKELSTFFFRIVNGTTISTLNGFENIKQVTLYNRLHNTPFKVNDFSIEQLLHYNIKQHNDLCSMLDNKDNNRDLVLKLMLMVGYKRAKYILSIDNSVETLEHLVGNVTTSDIEFDKNKNPILKNRWINMLFNDKENPRIKQLLLDKSSPEFKYFPRMFNEWDAIISSHQDKNMASIIEFLSGAEVRLPPKYYRLAKELKYIGCSNEIVSEAKECHDKSLKRIESSIPRVRGSIDGYEYEILRLNDIEGMSVGNKTDCCFTIKGRAMSSLIHAMTSKDGRILVVKKDGKLLAHSWIWRNGGLLCIDSIEVFKGNKDYGFKNVYLDMSNKIIDITGLHEGIDGITTIIVGGNTLPTKLGLPTVFKGKGPKLPMNYFGYTDTGSYGVIKGGEFFKPRECKYTYQDERKETLVYEDKKVIDDVEDCILEQINYLRYCKCEEEGNLDKFIKKISLYNINKIYLNDDWYILVDKKGNIESYFLPYDLRAKEEYDNVINLIKNENIKKCP